MAIDQGTSMPDEAKPKITPEEAAKTHNAPIIRRPETMAPEVARFANVSQMIFHPTIEKQNELQHSSFPEKQSL